MTEIVKLEEQFAILREGELSKTPVRVLKQGDSFAVFDPRGDIVPTPASEHGLYHAGTRFLSRFELLLGRRQPLLLSSTISDDNVVFTADLTNPDVVKDGHVMLTRGTLHFFRSRVLANGSWIECLRITNHGLHPIEATLAFRFDADFADVFEVRGTRRPSRGWRLPDVAGADLVLSYRGLDGVERRTRVRCARTPDRVEEASLFFLVGLEPHAWTQIELDISCELDHQIPAVRRFGDAVTDLRQQVARDEEHACVILSSNQAFNRWIQRSAADLRMMVTDTPYGAYPYAGIPWFSTPFGRDGLITALELLWVAPHIARGVLAFLAETQATATDDAQDAQPGKILHEMRSGEMATLKEIPFGRYYGTADATRFS
jgi:glycogen debranching enzyme